MSPQTLSSPRVARAGLSYIEHLVALSKKDVCSTHNRAILRAVDEPTKSIYYIRPVCKLWSCPECGDRNRRWWTARTIYGHEQLAEHGAQMFFWTITAHEKVRTFEHGLSIWRRSWNALSCQLRRRVDGLSYMRVFEHHKDGAFHVHLITNGQPPDKRWIKDAPRMAGMGYMNEIELVRSKFRSGFYISKYLAKSLDDADWPQNVRRIQPSHSWPKLPSQAPESPFSWQIVPFGTDITREIRQFRRRGYGVATF